MLRQAPQPVLASMRRLANIDEDFKAILEWLAIEREEAVRTMAASRDAWTAPQFQGAVQTLDAFLDTVQRAKR